MIAQLVYAVIKDSTVKNIIVATDIESAQMVSRAVFGEDAFAIETTYVPCMEGDIYRDHEFYRPDENGNEILIERMPTEADEIKRLKQENKELTTLLADIIGGESDAQ